MPQIRQATVEDVPSLLPLVEGYWAWEGIAGFDSPRASAQLARLLAEPRLGRGWTAFVDGMPVGYLLAVYVFSLEHSGLTAEIDELFVLPQHRGRGIGAQLLRMAESTFASAGCTRVSLQLSRDNDAARVFYRRQGYTERTGCELLDKRLRDGGGSAAPATRRTSTLREPVALLAATGLALVWSGLKPFDRATWWLEVAPVLIGAPVLVATISFFRLSPLLYRLLFLHAILLVVGGHYTYARVPIGFWAQDLLDLSRNHYDRVGHLAQGFVPAILAREILLRRSPLRRGAWLCFLTVCVCLGFSAFYELIEWWAALLWGKAADAFLGTQGDVWDTQWDLFLALLGSVASLGLLGRAHDRSMESVSTSPRREMRG